VLSARADRASRKLCSAWLAGEGKGSPLTFANAKAETLPAQSWKRTGGGGLVDPQRRSARPAGGVRLELK